MAQTSDGLTPDVIRELLLDAVRHHEWEITHDDLYDLAPRFGEEVFMLYWDSGGPGAGAGVERVYRLGGKYLKASDSFGWDGPYDTLDQAHGTIFVTGATREITCSEWGEDEIIARMELHDPRSSLMINGTEWPLETLEHRHARLRGEWPPASPAPDDDARDPDDVPELFMGPAIRMEGDVFRADPPAEPTHVPAAALREAAWLVREGEASLATATRDLPRAELRFRAAGPVPRARRRAPPAALVRSRPHRGRVPPPGPPRGGGGVLPPVARDPARPGRPHPVERRHHSQPRAVARCPGPDG